MSISSVKHKKNLLVRLLKNCTLLSVVVVILISLLLKTGIELTSLNIGRVHLSEVSLIWKTGLELEVATLKIDKDSAIKKQLETQASKEPTDLPIRLKTLPQIAQYFSLVSIKTITFAGFSGSLHCTEQAGQQSYFTLKSKDFDLIADLSLSDKNLTAVLTQLSSKRFKSQITGKIVLDLQKRSVAGDLIANIAESLPAKLSFTADTDGLSFKGEEAGKIVQIKPVVDLFGIDKDIEPWISAYLSGSRYRLKTFKGNFPWDNPLLILDTLYAEITIDDCEYIFAEGFEPIKTDYADVVYEKGVLIIKPHNPTFYGQHGKESWLDINFNDPDDIFLTAYIEAPATLNDDILRLLEFYEISLPFKQVKGKTGADLKLTLHFNHEIVKAQGRFEVTDSVFEHDGYLFEVTDGLVLVNDSLITIEKLKATYPEMFVATASGEIDGEKGSGELDIILKELHIQAGDALIGLKKESPRPEIHFSFTPESQSYTAGSSSLVVDDIEIDIAPFGGQFNYSDLGGKISPVVVSSPRGIETEISGSFSINKQSVDVQGKVLKYAVDNLQLENTDLPFSIRYDNQLSISSHEISNWRLDNTAVILNPLQLSSSSNEVSFVSDRLLYGDVFDGEISGFYDYKRRTGNIFFHKVILKGHELGEVQGTITSRPQSTLVNFPDFNLLIDVRQGPDPSWSANITDLAPLHERSELLQKYHIKAGNIQVSSNRKSNYTFSANLPYTVPVLVKDSTPISAYTISGHFIDGVLWATVNNELIISYNTNRLSLTSDTIGFNVPEIISLLQEDDKTEDNTQNELQNLQAEAKAPFSLTLDAYNTFLYLTPKNRAPADNIYLEYADKKMTVNLQHGGGTISMDSSNQSFSLEGKELNDVFMGTLLENSTFKGGRMSVVALGKFDNFSMLVKVNNTLLKEHQAFNNIMAFLNTVPALVTFSNPDYSTRGVFIDSVVAGAVVKKGIATFESLEMKSPLFNITGTGWVDFANLQVDMDMNLITQAKTNIQKIPLIGYILAGNKKHPSITLKVTGDLTDPDVENPLFQEVVTIPFSMLYRTLKLPLDLVEKLGE